MNKQKLSHFINRSALLSVSLTLISFYFFPDFEYFYYLLAYTIFSFSLFSLKEAYFAWQNNYEVIGFFFIKTKPPIWICKILSICHLVIGIISLLMGLLLLIGIF